MKTILLTLMLTITTTVNAAPPTLSAWRTFGSSPDERGVTLVSMQNTSTVDGTVFTQGTPGRLMMQVSGDYLSDHCHSTFVTVDTRNGNTGSLTIEVLDSTLTPVSHEAVSVQVSGDDVRHIFFLESFVADSTFDVVFDGQTGGLHVDRIRVIGRLGTHVRPYTTDLSGPTFTSDDKIVLSYYFYWYNVYTKAHFLNGDKSDALQDHPENKSDYSFTSVEWHKREMRDMMAAGIDVMLPVYWGASRELSGWAAEGVLKLVQAQQEMIAAGENPPKIGMFFDTSTLEHSERMLKYSNWKSDLTNDFGRAFFFKHLRDFYSMIPPELWARIDGKPIVTLYGANFASGHDESTFTEARRLFSQAFGGVEPFIIEEASWGDAVGDLDVAWGAALNGPRIRGTVAIGPGYNDSAVPGRTTPIRDRGDGGFYSSSWETAIASGRKLVFLETWNEFHEGTDIARSREFGDKYIQLTRKYVDIFHQPLSFLDAKPSGWTRILTPDVSIKVAFDDSVHLDRTTARCEYSNDGGTSWHDHPIAAVSPHGEGWMLVAADVPFENASRSDSTQNLFRFAVTDTATGHQYESFAQNAWLGYPPAVDARVILGDPDSSFGIRHVGTQSGDGWTEPGVIGGISARKNISAKSSHYFYFDVDDSLVFAGSTPDLRAEIVYWNGIGNVILPQYDSRGDFFMARYANAESAPLTGGARWKTRTFDIPGAWFGNRQNGGADFRIYADNEVWIHSVRIYSAIPVAVNDNETSQPARLHAGDAIPNPFNAETAIPISIPVGETATLHIFSVAGQLVRTMTCPPGPYTGRVTWNGRDARGTRVGSGVYVVALRGSRSVSISRLTLAR
jgi:hypothetical protein